MTTTTDVKVQVEEPAAEQPGLTKMHTGLRITDIDPDINKDGKIDKEEAKIFKILKDADADGSGFLTTSEVYRALAEFVQSEKTSSQRKSMLIGAVSICLLMLACTIGLTACVVFLSKDTKLSGAKMVSMAGKPIQMSSTPVLGKVDLLQYPKATDQNLTMYLKSPIVLKKGTNGASMMMKIAGYDRSEDGSLTMYSEDNKVLLVNSTTVIVTNALGKRLLFKTTTMARRQLQQEQEEGCQGESCESANEAQAEGYNEQEQTYYVEPQECQGPKCGEEEGR